VQPSSLPQFINPQPCCQTSAMPMPSMSYPLPGDVLGDRGDITLIDWGSSRHLSSPQSMNCSQLPVTISVARVSPSPYPMAELHCALHQSPSPSSTSAIAADPRQLTHRHRLGELPQNLCKNTPPPAPAAGRKNHGTRDSQVVPHLGTNRAALSLTSQIGRDAVLSESYGRGC
jgi:hypothetical protein